MNKSLINFFEKFFPRKEKNYDIPLTSNEWGEIYNPSQIEFYVKKIGNKDLNIQTIEMLKISQKGDKILEIGSGSGETSVSLAINGRNAFALDFSEECLTLTKEIAKNLNVNLTTLCIDCFDPLPFSENEFDWIFQAGLLEHFSKEERIKLLQNWGKYTKKMVSLIPNAASIAYRVGKAIMEKNNSWRYGIEMPQYSLIQEFYEAGFKVTNEYTIGVEQALNFLPPKHYLRKTLQKWNEQNLCEDICGQGYLLVTIGEKI